MPCTVYKKIQNLFMRWNFQGRSIQSFIKILTGEIANIPCKSLRLEYNTLESILDYKPKKTFFKTSECKQENQ